MIEMILNNKIRQIKINKPDNKKNYNYLLPIAWFIIPSIIVLFPAPVAPTTTDVCSGTITGTTSTVFPITVQGTTVVTWTFDDGNGQSIDVDQNSNYRSNEI